MRIVSHPCEGDYHSDNAHVLPEGESYTDSAPVSVASCPPEGEAYTDSVPVSVASCSPEGESYTDNTPGRYPSHPSAQLFTISNNYATPLHPTPSPLVSCRTIFAMYSKIITRSNVVEKDHKTEEVGFESAGWKRYPSGTPVGPQ